MRFPTLTDAASVLSLLPATQKALNAASAPAPPPSLEIPGDSPFSLCPASRPTDLFQIKSLIMSKQPVFM